MSTEYELIKRNDGSVLSALERSGRFEVCAFGYGDNSSLGNGNDQVCFDGLSPEDLEKIALHLLAIASYNGGEMFDKLGLQYPTGGMVIKKQR